MLSLVLVRTLKEMSANRLPKLMSTMPKTMPVVAVLVGGSALALSSARRYNENENQEAEDSTK